MPLGPWLLPAALGATLAGVVADPDGEPVAGAEVQLVDPAQGYVVVTTDPSGRFEAAGLPAGTWRVLAIPPASSALAPAWAPSERHLCDGDRVRIERTTVRDDLWVAVGPGGALTGRLVDAGGLPVSGATVTALPLDGSASREVLTGADGGFLAEGLPSGEVIVELESATHPIQLLQGVFDVLDAEVFDVPAGGIVDVGERAPLAGAAVDGWVEDLAGEPIADALVQVYSPSELRSATTGPDGSFAVTGLPAGDLQVWGTAAGFATTWWPDGDRAGSSFPVGPGRAEVGLALVLPPESRIEGRLVGVDDPGAARLWLYNSDRTVGWVATVEADGRFGFGGLHGGDYTALVEAGPAGGVTGPLLLADGSEWRLTVADAAVLDLGDVPVRAGGTVDGRVTEAGTGRPVIGALVVASPGDPFGSATARTDDDGRYRIVGLAPGAWELTASFQPACVGDDGWVPLVYPGTPNPVLALPVVVSEGQAVSWSPTLPPDDDHDGMDDRWEAAHGLDPTRDDGAEDADGDGTSNLDEYLFGTDPAAAASVACGCATTGPGPVPLLLGLAALVGRRRRQPWTTLAPFGP